MGEPDGRELMGITLEAQVELEELGDPRYGIGPRWHAVARWDFGKDYAASIAMHNCGMARLGWPRDAQVEPHEAEICDQGRQWIEAQFLPVVSDSRPIWQALEASVLVLLKTKRRVRVLFWRM